MNLLFYKINSNDITSIVLIIICLSVILLLSIYIIYDYLKKKKNNKLKDNYHSKIDELNQKIEEISRMSNNEIKEYIISNYEHFLKDEKIKKIYELKNECNNEIEKYTKNLIIDSMESCVSEYIEKTEEIIDVPSDSIGRFIGKDGFNIKVIEKITMCQPYVIKNENAVRISSTNGIRKEIASRLIKKLIKNKTFDKTRIEKNYESILFEFKDDCIKEGKKILSKLNIKYENEKLFEYVGRLKYRTSFKQNVLSHLIECSYIAKNIASNLNLDQNIAIECAFFHDIGKSIDFEENGDHVKSGINIAKECNLSSYVINAIESHHDDTEPNNIYSKIAKVADKISASRPGVRNNSEQINLERIQNIEMICNSFKEVNKSYVVRNGKEVIVIVDNTLTNKKFKSIGERIKKEINKNEKVNYWDIKITIISEKTYSL